MDNMYHICLHIILFDFSINQISSKSFLKPMALVKLCKLSLKFRFN